MYMGCFVSDNKCVHVFVQKFDLRNEFKSILLSFSCFNIRFFEEKKNLSMFSAIEC